MLIRPKSLWVSFLPLLTLLNYWPKGGSLILRAGRSPKLIFRHIICCPDILHLTSSTHGLFRFFMILRFRIRQIVDIPLLDPPIEVDKLVSALKKPTAFFGREQFVRLNL